ncbi:hypothetical protein LSTR_LSTR008671 [Laodelphax striatellus]|uniref:Axin n=1 Tax=Laodelphax striatellus TaxID=195883 RepID=A0A482X4W1_LAOST|nr:hypothetical protein LSTR_LSTR008671 [Laodelphax striatellus]
MSVPVRTTAIENSFHENSQRPPVEPGAETVQSGEPVGSSVSGSGWGSPGKFTTMGRSSPVSMPSVSHAHIAEKLTAAPHHASSSRRGGGEHREACEGGCGGGGGGSRSPPAYLRWARHLHILLQDPDGVALFRRYLESEGRVHADTLDFWFACEGLRKQQDAESVTRLVKVIYRRYFVKMELGIGSELRKEVHQKIKEGGGGGGGQLAVSVFDRAQQQVERLITDTMYPNFLHSELYLQHVQAMQNGSNTTSTGSDSSLSSSSGSGGGGGTSSSNTNSGGGGSQATGGGYLATLHEDCELESPAAASCTAAAQPRGSAALPLTRDMLLATQKRRASELRPKPEAYAGLYLQSHGKPSHHQWNWVRHSSYNPVSRQDSELQSLSSDARTDSDCLSMTDTSSIREGSGSHHRYSKKQYQLHCKQVKENASLNRDPYMYHTVIPRTQRVQKEQIYPMKPDEFAAILIEKLENLKKDQETKESLDRKLMETGELTDNVGSIGPTTLADAIRGKLRVEDDGDDQDILDQHVSRVWSDRTPGLASPPEFLRRPRPPIPQNHGKMSSNVPPSMMSPFSMPMHMYQSKTHQRYSHSHSRKEKDVFSNFSSDSGNVHDFTEGSEHRMHVPKSKSMPEYTDTLQSSHDGRFRQSGFRDWSGSGSGGGSRRWSSKKTELTDSGVSVVSDTPSLAHTNKDRRVLSWLMESDKQHMVSGLSQTLCGSAYSGGGGGGGERDSLSSCGGKSHRCGSSRSGSLERPRPVPTGGGGSRGGGGGGAAQPAQPFVADPSMPPLPLPHTPDQLEEARRRLLEDETRTKQPRPRFPNKSLEPSATHSHSSGSTLRRSVGGGGGGTRSSRGAEPPLPTPPPVADAPCTIVVFSFCDEQFPYRTKIPGHHVTLRQFKEYLPKKGLYRYFFKTECEDLDMKVIQEEIVDDNEVLPLWEGKVMAQVKPVE